MNDPIDISPLAIIDTKVLVSCFAIIIVVALLLAYYFRNSYKVSTMLKAYGIFSAVFFIVLLFFKVKIVLIIGMLLMGLVILGFRSNRYFYH